MQLCHFDADWSLSCLLLCVWGYSEKKKKIINCPHQPILQRLRAHPPKTRRSYEKLAPNWSQSTFLSGSSPVRARIGHIPEWTSPGKPNQAIKLLVNVRHSVGSVAGSEVIDQPAANRTAGGDKLSQHQHDIGVIATRGWTLMDQVFRGCTRVHYRWQFVSFI